jgi:hypothetical protein
MFLAVLVIPVVFMATVLPWPHSGSGAHLTLSEAATTPGIAMEVL